MFLPVPFCRSCQISSQLRLYHTSIQSKYISHCFRCTVCVCVCVCTLYGITLIVVFTNCCPTVHSSVLLVRCVCVWGGGGCECVWVCVVGQITSSVPPLDHHFSFIPCCYKQLLSNGNLYDHLLFRSWTSYGYLSLETGL